MTVQEAITKWSEAATVTKAGETFVRDGNWQISTRALRHFIGENLADIKEAGKLNGDAVIEVSPKPPFKANAPHSARNRPPFYLVVK